MEIFWLFLNSFQHFTNECRINLEHPVAILLLQIIVIIIVSRIFAFICRKFSQPVVLGEIVAGILLGPSLLGLYFPDLTSFLFPPKSLSGLDLLSQIGLVLFMFLVGMDLDFKAIKIKTSNAVIISHASIAIPFGLGVGLGYFLYNQFAPVNVGMLSFTLFIGVAISITAFPVLARIVKERGISKTELGMMVITCAAVDDITAWCILAALIALVHASSLYSLIYVILITAIYILFMLKVVRPCFQKLLDKYLRKELTKAVIAVTFIVLLVSALITQMLGLHPLFGAFMAGIIMPSKLNFRSRVGEKLEDIVLLLFLPLFFVFTGLRTQIALLKDLELLKTCVIIILVAITGKFVGSSIAAKLVGQSIKDSLIIGALMNTRGLVELVALNIGYDLGILSPEVFLMMVIMALVTTFMTGPALNLIEKLFSADLKKCASEPKIVDTRTSVSQK